MMIICNIYIYVIYNNDEEANIEKRVFVGT